MNIVQKFILNNPIKPLQRIFARQFGNPTGFMGGILARLMNKGNLIMNTGVVAEMELAPEHHALDIGFGGGVALKLMLERIAGGKVVGMEMSSDMIEKAHKTFGSEITSGRLELIEGLVDNIPLEPSSMDRVCTVNTIYFWPQPKAAFEEITRILRPGGRLVVGMRPREVMQQIAFTKYGFTIYAPEDIVRIMDEAGFQNTSYALMEDDGIGHFCITGLKPNI